MGLVKSKNRLERRIISVRAMIFCGHRVLSDSNNWESIFRSEGITDGRERKRSISRERYNRYARTSHRRTGRPNSVDLSLTPGALGLTFIERGARP